LLFAHLAAQANCNLLAQLDEFGELVKEQDFLLGDRVFPREAFAQDEKGEGFGDVFFGAGGGVVSDELVFVGVVELVETVVVAVIVFFQVNVFPLVE
jgi:hypothetical protein